MSVSAIVNPLNANTYLIFYLDNNNNVAVTTSSAASPTTIASANQVNVNDDTSVAVGNMVDATAIVALYLNDMVNVYGFYKGTPAKQQCSDAGPQALAQIVPGFQKLVSDDTLLIKSQLAGCTNASNTEGVLYYVTVGGNLNAWHLLDMEAKIISSGVEIQSNLAAAWGGLGGHNPEPHVAYQQLTPGEDSVYDIIIRNTETRASATIVADSMFPSPLALTFNDGLMYVYYFGQGHELKRAVFKSYNDQNPATTTLSDAPKLNTATQMTAVVNAPKGSQQSITLYYIGKNNKLAGYEDNL